MVLAKWFPKPEPKADRNRAVLHFPAFALTTTLHTTSIMSKAVRQ
jgi:hypothetical protein